MGGQTMNKEEQVISGFRDLFNKMAWLNKSNMYFFSLSIAIFANLL